MKSERLSKVGKRAVGRGVGEAAKRRLMNLFLQKAMVLEVPDVARKGSFWKRYTGVSGKVSRHHDCLTFLFGKYELDQCRCGTSDPFFSFVVSGFFTLFTTLASTPTLFLRSVCLVRQDHTALDSACTQNASAAAGRSPSSLLDRIDTSHHPGSKPCPISLELNEPASSIERLNQAGPGAMASVLTEPTHILTFRAFFQDSELANQSSRRFCRGD